MRASIVEGAVAGVLEVDLGKGARFTEIDGEVASGIIGKKPEGPIARRAGVTSARKVALIDRMDITLVPALCKKKT